MSKGFGNLLRQAKQMQKQIVEAREELKQKTYEGSSGQDKVRAIVSGSYELKSLSIEKDVVDHDDIEMLEDLILLAVNEAISRAKEESEGEMEKLTGGMGIDVPGMF
ncbi:Nucleoid-associated protein YaaK [hydrothermal vent metagenome]|uniref:Nucleoid-associated protein YaaK n=1 Tax=hydrothermal vent metagenome TaxID=652676 RepID=A0A3B1D1Y2_9ZZZZ